MSDSVAGTKQKDDTQAVHTVTARTLQVLDAFAVQPAWGVRELAAYLHLPKSGVGRTLQEFASEGLLALDPEGIYHVSGRLLHLASRLVTSFDLPRIAMPLLIDARDRSSETTVLTIYDADRQVFAAITAAESRQAVRYNWEGLREWRDLWIGAAGKVILAALPDDERDQVVARIPDPFMGPQPKSKQAILHELNLIRARGWGSSHGERHMRAQGVAAAVRGPDGYPLGSVVIASPDHGLSLTETELGDIVKELADKLSARLGWAETTG